MFAARLMDVVQKKANPIYQDPKTYFDNTFPTAGLKQLAKEVMGRMSGEQPDSSPFIRLETAFGGGKTHNLIALYHLASGELPEGMQGLVPDSWLPDEPIPSAAVVGSEVEPDSPTAHGDIETNTIWGEIAWQLGGKDAYKLMRKNDEELVAPGVGILEQILGDKPALIMLDELARYIRSAKVVQTPNKKSDLAEQSVGFIMSLIEFAASRPNVVLVLTLAESSDAFADETAYVSRQLEELKHISSRQEMVLTPTQESEISKIVCHRLFQEVDSDAGADVAAAYTKYFGELSDREVETTTQSLRAEYRAEMAENYPFHPELITTLNRKTSTIPNFQKTRGALRLLARVVQRLWEEKPDNTHLIHLHHIPLGLEDVAVELTSRLEKSAFKQVIEADIASPQEGSLSHCQMIDEKLWRESNKPDYAQRLGTTIFINSLTQGTSSGLDEGELFTAVLEPGDDPKHVKKTLAIMMAEEQVQSGMACFYLHYSGQKYRFKTDASITKIIQEEVNNVRAFEVKTQLETFIKRIWKPAALKPYHFPDEAADLPDDAGMPKLAILHYDSVSLLAEETDIPELVLKLYNHSGMQQAYRTYKNNVLFLCADRDRISRTHDVMRRLLALQKIVNEPERMNDFSKEQKKKLRDNLDSAQLDVRVALTRLYRFLYYPSTDVSQEDVSLRRYEIPAQDQGNAEKNQTEIVLETLKQLEKVLTEDSQTVSAAYLKSKAWPESQDSMTTEDLRRQFAQSPGLKMLLDTHQLKKTVSNGIKTGNWIYYDKRDQIGYDKDSPEPLIEITDDAVLYLPDAADEKDIPIKGKKKEEEVVCPICGKYPCVCGMGPGEGGGPGPGGTGGTEEPGAIYAEGDISRALQKVMDLFSDKGLKYARTLKLSCADQGSAGLENLQAIALSIPQLPKSEKQITLGLSAGFTPFGELKLDFSGTWDRFKRLKQTALDFSDEAEELNVAISVKLTFPEKTEAESALSDLKGLLSSLGVGVVRLEAEGEK
jgi:hypothetical protein